MSCGKTVIFTKSYGVEEYRFVNFKNAILVPPGNRDRVIRSIKKIYFDKSKLASIGKEARQLVLKGYNLNDYSLTISNTFKKVLKHYK